MTSIAKVLSGVNRLFIDTAPLIYLIEQHPSIPRLCRK